MKHAMFLSITTAVFALGIVGCAVNLTAAPVASTAASAAAQPTLVVSTNPPPATATSIPAALPTPTEPSNPPQTASTPADSGRTTVQTITMNDNGRTITLQVGEQFLLNLCDNLDWQWQIDYPAIVSRVPNVLTIRGSQGLFEARQPGQTTLTARGDPPCRKAQPACMTPSFLFRAQIVVRANVAATPTTPSSAPNTVTYADNGQTITLHVGDRFLLKLGDQFTWNVSVSDPAIVSRVVNIAVVQGAQGVYQANKAGDTMLSAVGLAVCPPLKVCPDVAIGFKLHIIVQ